METTVLMRTGSGSGFGSKCSHESPGKPFWSPPRSVRFDLRSESSSALRRTSSDEIWSDRKVKARTSVVEEEVEFGGGGGSRGRRVGRREGGDDGEKSGIGDYYREMLRSDPENSLLLRNYGKFLHEVKGDVAGAEECYERAILASPGDGEVLSLYGSLLWETQKDETRADVYYQRAVEASPQDSSVLASYAHFLWNAEEEEEEETSKF